jgi:hypothetical protein
LPLPKSACIANACWPLHSVFFSRFGFDEGVAGYITARDPEQTVASRAQPFDALYFIDTMKPATLI